MDHFNNSQREFTNTLNWKTKIYIKKRKKGEEEGERERERECEKDERRIKILQTNISSYHIIKKSTVRIQVQYRSDQIP